MSIKKFIDFIFEGDEPYFDRSIGKMIIPELLPKKKKSKAERSIEKMKSMVDLKIPYYVIQERGKSFSLDIGYLTDKNIGGFGKGIRGAYFFSEEELSNALSGHGDYLGRFLYKLGEEENLLEKIYSINEYDEREAIHIGENKFIVNNVIKTRMSYCSADPNQERNEGVYYEIEDLCKFLKLDPNKFDNI